MKFDIEIKQSLQITVVFSVITSIFALLAKLSTFALTGVNQDSIINFLEGNILRFIVVILIILGVYIYLKKVDGKCDFSFIYNPFIRLTSGFLIIFEGIMRLSDKVTNLFFNLQIFLHQESVFDEKNADLYIRSIFVSIILPIIINLVQILFGLYYALHKKRKNEIK